MVSLTCGPDNSIHNCLLRSATGSLLTAGVLTLTGLFAINTKKRWLHTGVIYLLVALAMIGMVALFITAIAAGSPEEDAHKIGRAMNTAGGIVIGAGLGTAIGLWMLMDTYDTTHNIPITIV